MCSLSYMTKNTCFFSVVYDACACSSMDRALDYESRSCGFDSFQARVVGPIAQLVRVGA
jgi:hypothetical protein